MSKKTIAILKSYFETGDRPTEQQFADLIDSFIHKDAGVTTSNRTFNADTGLVRFEYSDSTAFEFTVPQKAPISFITGLQAALNNKVDKIEGKGLSTLDFTNALSAAITAATQHAANADIHVTPQEKTNWDNKVDKEEGKGLSTNDYNEAEAQKVADAETHRNNSTLHVIAGEKNYWNNKINDYREAEELVEEMGTVYRFYNNAVIRYDGDFPYTTPVEPTIDADPAANWTKVIEGKADATIENVAELKTRKGKEGESVELLGYYSKSDGGGGLMYWDPISTETANDGTIFAVTGETSGRWKRVFSNEIRGKWFGTVGDGVANETAVINKAFDALKNNMRIVFEGQLLTTPNGVFRVEIRENILVDLHNAEFITEGGSDGYSLLFKNFTNIKVLGGKFKNNNSTVPERMRGVGFSDCDSPTIDGARFFDSFYAITVTGSQRATVVNCKGFGVLPWNETDNANGIVSASFVYATNTDGLTVKNNYSYRHSHHILANHECKNLLVDGNHIVETSDSSIYFGSGGNVITNNRIIRAGKDGIKSNGLANGITEGIEDNNIVKGNYIEGCGLEKSDGGAAIQLCGHYGIIEGNIVHFPDFVYAASRSGVVIWGKQTLVKDNMIMGFSSVDTTTLSAIVFRRGGDHSGTHISGNIVHKAGVAIASGGEEAHPVTIGVTISDNKFIDCFQGIQSLQIFAGVRKKGFKIINNDFQQIGNKAIDLERVENFLIKGNTGDVLNNTLVRAVGCDNTSICDNIVDGGGIYTPVSRSFEGMIYSSTTLIKKGNYSAGILEEEIGNYYIENNVIRVAQPEGGQKYLPSPTTGAIKIKLPVLFNHNFIKFDINIQNYADDSNLKISVGGILHISNESWEKVSAQTLSTSGAPSASQYDPPIRFGHDGETACVWVGGLSHNWTLPSVTISNFFASYIGTGDPVSKQWAKNWEISIATAFDTVQVEKNNNFYLTHWDKVKGKPTNLETTTGAQNKANTAEANAKAYADTLTSKRPEKRITNATQYTAVKEDATKYLVFDNPVEFIINDGVFAKDDELEGDTEGGDVTVSPAAGVTLLYLETQRPVILNKGPFGMRFKAANKASLFGALKPL